MNPDIERRKGVFFTTSAFLWWGLIPIYFRWIGHIPAKEIVVHRTLGIVCVGFLILTYLGKVDDVREILRSRALVSRLALSGSLIGVNWLVFTWAAANEQILDVSMGYFISPLMYVILGVVVLGERLRTLQAVSVGIAFAGVGYLVYSTGQLPWISIVLPLTFSLYGLIRKKTPVHALAGLVSEMIVLSPIALLYLLWLVWAGRDHLISNAAPLNFWLLLAGPVSLFPLTIFAAGAKRISLTAVGFLQYLGPSLSFMIAVFAFGEPLESAKMATFCMIWISLALFSIDGLRSHGVEDKLVPEPVACKEGACG